MEMTSSHFFICVKAISKLLLSFILVVGSAATALADIGETFDLKQKRAALQTELRTLRNDSAASVGQLMDVHARIVELDEKIFESYDETVSRMAANQTNASDRDKVLVWLALFTTLISIFFAILLAMARDRVIDKGFGLADIYKQLSFDFFQKVSPEHATSQRMIRINVVIIIGMIFMGVSIIGFLISKF